VAAHEGIVVKQRADGKTSYMAHVWDSRATNPKTGKQGVRVRKTFPTLAAAKGWRADATSQMHKGVSAKPSSLTLGQAADQWLEGAKSGAIVNRSGDAYKPSAVRGYDQALKLRLIPRLGAGTKLSDVRSGDLQRLVEKMQGDKLNASTIRNTFMPLRAIYRRAIELEDVHVNPTTNLRLPSARGTRDRIAAPDEGTLLIAALPIDERALWATAMYAGLRLGELLALRWEDVNFATGKIRVERAFDPKAGFVAPKSQAGKRGCRSQPSYAIT